MPQNEKDPFEEYDDENDDFLTFDARDQEEGINKGPIILAAVALLLAVFGAILFVYFTGGKAKDAPQLASDTSSYKEMPMENATNALANGTVAGSDNAMAATADKSVYDATNGTNPPPLEVQPSGSSETPMVSQNSVSAPAAATAASVAATPPRPKAVTEPATAPKATAEKTTAPSTASASTAVKEPVKETKAAPVVKTASTTKAAGSANDAAENTANTAKASTAAKTETARNGAYSAQLGSFKTKDAADEALKDYRAKGLTGPVSVSSADLGGKGTWYRIRATGFESRQQAASFCSKSTNVGVNCIPARD